MKIFNILMMWVLVMFAESSMSLTPMPVDHSRPVILSNASLVHIGNGQVIQNAAVAMAEGKITAVGSIHDMAELPGRANYQVVDLNGQQIYPGFILPGSNLGLNEIGSLGDTVDQSEAGSLNPNVRSLVAYNTDSELIPVTRFNGVLTAQVSPQGGMLSGQSSIMQLDAWNWEDAALKVDDGVHLNWPSRKNNQFDFSTFTVKLVDNKQYDKQVAQLEQLFADATSYQADQDRVAKNLKLEALLGLFDADKALFVNANLARDIIDAVDFGKRHKVKRIVIISGSETLKVADYLSDNQIPVIINGLHVTPRFDHQAVDLPFRVPAELTRAGVKVGLTYPGVMNARNLPFIAGTASAYGLSREQALQIITLNNAEILGIGDYLGSLEVGKNATLFVSSGDALDMRSNQLTHAFIDGRQIQLEGSQQQLYQRFHDRYAQANE